MSLHLPELFRDLCIRGLLVSFIPGIQCSPLLTKASPSITSPAPLTSPCTQPTPLSFHVSRYPTIFAGQSNQPSLPNHAPWFSSRYLTIAAHSACALGQHHQCFTLHSNAMNCKNNNNVLGSFSAIRSNVAELTPCMNCKYFIAFGSCSPGV